MQSAALVIHQAGDVHRLWAGVGLRTRESPTVWSALSRRPLPPRCHSTPCRQASPVGAPQRVCVCVCVCLCVCNARRYLPRYPRSPHTLLPPCTPRHCPGWVQRRKPLAATDEHLATRGLRAYSHTRICMYAHTKLTRAPAPIHARTRVRTRARTYTCTHAWRMGWSRTAV